MAVRSILIVNCASGSYDSLAVERIEQALAENGHPLAATLGFPDDDIPDPAALDRDGIRRAIVFTGDGTLNTVYSRLKGWGGAILILPGGTLNLLSKKLHGDRPAEAIVADLGRCVHVRPPIIRGAGIEALVGIIAGPTTIWGNVREEMRKGDTDALLEELPLAYNQSVDGPRVSIEGYEGYFPAVNMTPADEGIRLKGFLTDNAWHLIQHGFAWLGGDFRNGPHDMLGVEQEVVIEGEEEIGMLYDGEQGSFASMTRFVAGRAEIDFVATDTPSE